MSNHSPTKVCDERTYLYPTLMDVPLKIENLISKLTSLVMIDVINYTCWTGALDVDFLCNHTRLG